MPIFRSWAMRSKVPRVSTRPSSPIISAAIRSIRSSARSPTERTVNGRSRTYWRCNSRTSRAPTSSSSATLGQRRSSNLRNFAPAKLSSPIPASRNSDGSAPPQGRNRPNRRRLHLGRCYIDSYLSLSPPPSGDPTHRGRTFTITAEASHPSSTFIDLEVSSRRSLLVARRIVDFWAVRLAVVYFLDRSALSARLILRNHLFR